MITTDHIFYLQELTDIPMEKDRREEKLDTHKSVFELARSFSVVDFDDIPMAPSFKAHWE
jgi:hypothetical protein